VAGGVKESNPDGHVRGQRVRPKSSGCINGIVLMKSMGDMGWVPCDNVNKGNKSQPKSSRNKREAM